MTRPHLLLLGLLACEGSKDGFDSSTVVEGGTPDTTYDYFSTTMDCGWEEGGLDLILTGGARDGYLFGLAETDCDGSCWTGEDCVYGYIASDGTSLGYCHSVAPTGLFLTTVGSYGELIESSTTLHTPELHNTYFLAEKLTGDCWIWGYNTGYYEGLGCADIGGGCSGE